MPEPSTIKLTLLLTSDLHGHLYPTTYRDHTLAPIGLAKLATLIHKERQLTPDLLLIDNGDLIQGSPLAYYYAKFSSRELHPAVAALNVLNYNAAILGNHEFNYGPQLLQHVVQTSNFPWLSANIVSAAAGEPAFGRPYLIQQVQGIKIAVLGLTTHYIPNWEQPEHIAPYHFQDALKAAAQWVAEIRHTEQPDLLIVCYHGGFERDLETGALLEPDTGENQAYAICKEVDGIDVLVTGHQHRHIAAQLHGVTVIQPGCHGEALGKVSIVLERQDQHLHIVRKDAELLLPGEETLPDELVLQCAMKLETLTQRWLDQPIGEVVGDMTITNPFAARIEEHPFIEFLHCVQMDAAKVDISTTALFTNHCRGLTASVTMRDIVANYMYPNTLKVLRLSGMDIRDALEKSAAYFILNDQGELAVHPSYLEPKVQHYNYDMWEGIEYELNIAQPIGQRVVKLNRRGKPLELNAEYDVVMNNYRAAGGGDYDMFKGKPIIREIQTDMTELIAEYILTRQKIHARCNHNWRVLA